MPFLLPGGPFIFYLMTSLTFFRSQKETTSPKQPFLTLTQLRAPCYVDIWHSVLFPLDTCPNCGATFNFEIYLFLFFY